MVCCCIVDDVACDAGLARSRPIVSRQRPRRRHKTGGDGRTTTTAAATNGNAWPQPPTTTSTTTASVRIRATPTTPPNVVNIGSVVRHRDPIYTHPQTESARKALWHVRGRHTTDADIEKPFVSPPFLIVDRLGLRIHFC